MGRGDDTDMRTFDPFGPRRELPPLSRWSKRRRPRDYIEWKTLRDWDELPAWEEIPPGYLLREAREEAGMTQAELGERLEITQQAVAQAERWEANPTVAFVRRWAEACRRELSIELDPVDPR